MVTRRAVLLGGGSAGVAGALGGWAMLSAGGTGSGSRSTDGDATGDADHHCTATARRHPRTDRLSVLTVTSDPGTTTVQFRVADADGVETVAVVADDDRLARTPLESAGRHELAFERDGPTTFDLQVRDADGDVLDDTRIHVTCSE